MADRMFSGFLIACHYFPAASNKDLKDFILGRACTHCPELRPTCSRDFTSLCGLDLRLSSESKKWLQAPKIIIFLFVLGSVGI